uniref:Prolyl 4-hydroxylase alpha-subunit N-terminal domain-containing protein n=1 Tax=Clastoptera arizonana TaxID=38151 RepID=A0A1B6DQB5_9HEMI
MHTGLLLLLSAILSAGAQELNVNRYYQNNPAAVKPDFDVIAKIDAAKAAAVDLLYKHINPLLDFEISLYDKLEYTKEIILAEKKVLELIKMRDRREEYVNKGVYGEVFRLLGEIESMDEDRRRYIEYRYMTVHALLASLLIFSDDLYDEGLLTNKYRLYNDYVTKILAYECVDMNERGVACV